MTSAVLSAIGKCSSSPSRNSTLAAPTSGGVVARPGEHFVGHVDADHVAGRPHLTGGEKTVEPGAAAEVDHRFSWAQLGDRLGIAATQAEIGAVRDRRQFGVGVTHAAGLFMGIRRCRRATTGWRTAACRVGGCDVAVSRADQGLDIGRIHWVRPFPGSMFVPWQARPIMSTTFGELSYHRGFVLAMNAATGSPGGRCRHKSRSGIGLWYFRSCSDRVSRTYLILDNSLPCLNSPTVDSRPPTRYSATRLKRLFPWRILGS